MPEKLPTARRIAYGLGAGGWQITDRIVVAMLVYFYLPTEGRGLDTLLPDGVAFGVLTLFGAAMLVGRVFDSAADPLVGYVSDRSRSRLGRRRVFLLGGVLPMVGVPVLLFFPPGPAGSPLNFAWLAALLAVYFVFFTAYVAPYLALIPELATSQQDRVQLGTIVALASLPFALLVGVGWPFFYDALRETGLSATAAMQTLVAGFSVLALVLCLLPVAAVDERRYAHSVPSDLPLLGSLAATLANRAFRVYLAAQLLFLFGINLIQPAAPYIVTVMLGRSEGFAASLGVATLAGVTLGFAVQGALVRRFGPKRVMSGCLLLFALPVSLLGLLEPDVPGGPRDAANLALAFGAIALLGLPIAGLSVLPHVLIGQLIDEDEARTGANRSAMFFGVQGLLTKWVYGLSTGTFSFLLLRFGRSAAEPGGVILVGPVAAAACLLGLAIFAFYPERRILAAARVSGPPREMRVPRAPAGGGRRPGP